MKKESIIKTIILAAEMYRDNLLNMNVIFISTENGKVKFTETLFLPRNFCHLTGVVLTRNTKSSVDFFNKCISKTLSASDFELSQDGSTVQKMSVILQLMNIKSNARMLGIYNGTSLRIYTEVLIGGQSSCLGFVSDGDVPDYLLPNTALKIDIRDSVIKSERVIAILEKNQEQRKYSSFTYKAKSIDEQELTRIVEQCDKISIN